MLCQSKYLLIFLAVNYLAISEFGIYFVIQSAFMQQEREASIHALQDIRSMMAKSARFISLSGWSGIWAGMMALIGSWIARVWLTELKMEHVQYAVTDTSANGNHVYIETVLKFVFLAAGVFVSALAGAYFFTLRKTRADGVQLWNTASKRMLIEMAIPLVTGGVFALHFLYTMHAAYIAPICLAFYGLSLISGSKYTLSDIRYLGMYMLVLAFVSLFYIGNGLLFWALGFGVLHIVYGIAMWSKYEKGNNKVA